MKKILLTISAVLLVSTSSFAHYLWIETNSIGTLNQEQEIRVHYGEYTYGVVEEVNGDAFLKVNQFNLWIVDPLGNKTELKITAENTFYKATFKPELNGTYTVYLNNNAIDVIDYTQYNFGIFKTHYHSVAKIVVGNKQSETTVDNQNGITINDISENNTTVTLKVLFKNNPLQNNEVKIFVADLWSKTLQTDENGNVSFKLPWNTKYIIETTYKEEIPGKYNNENYQFIWHCVTYTIPSK